MADGQAQNDGSTTQAAAAQAQSCDAAPDPHAPAPAPSSASAERDGLGVRFRVAACVTREVARPFVRKTGDPLYRPLKVYTSDPDASRMEVAVALVNVPYEPLKPGPAGSFFKVSSADPQQKGHYQSADLEDPYVLMASGYAPSPSEPRFHQQVVYAVCSSVYAVFRGALGRHVAWGFQRETDPSRLELRPFAFKGANAWYDKEEGALCFGYDKAPATRVGDLPAPQLPRAGQDGAAQGAWTAGPGAAADRPRTPAGTGARTGIGAAQRPVGGEAAAVRRGCRVALPGTSVVVRRVRGLPDHFPAQDGALPAPGQ